MKSKDQKIKELVYEIKELLTNKVIKEKETGETQGCTACVFEGRCKANYRMPCMAHNRGNKDSIYYVNR